jgi:hypothetical protein
MPMPATVNPARSNAHAPPSRHDPARRGSQSADVVYFVASHVNPEQVARLVRACRSGNPRSRVLIHHNEQVTHLDPSLVQPFGNVDFLPESTDTAWGTFAGCEMVIGGLKWLLENRSFDWVVYLSGQDYPIRPLPQIEQALAESHYDGYLEAKPIEQCQWHIGILRYAYRFYRPPRFPWWDRVTRRLKEYADAQIRSGELLPPFVVPSRRHGFQVGVRPLRSPFSAEFRCYFGSAWWTLNRRSIEAMVRNYDRRPELARHYRRSLFAATESLFATLVLNDPALKICTSTGKRFVSWNNPETARPDVLRMCDLPRVLASDAFFARKFDATVDPEILDRLDQVIGITAIAGA